jgi:hypothetical protein
MAARGARVLYVCNEEPQKAIQDRFLSRLGATRLWDLDNPDPAIARAAYGAAIERAEARGWANVSVMHSAGVKLAEIPRYIEQVEPQVLVLDQIRNVGVGKGGEDSLTRSLEIAARALREWGDEYSMRCFGVAQAGDAAEGKSHLTLTHLDSSKTGAQGAFDVMIGVGVTQDMKLTEKRIINIPRNKVSGVETSFPIWLDTQHTAVRDKPVIQGSGQA